MGKKYYCDYCDKSFADNKVSRRNHLRGLQHRNNRKQYYATLQDPALILAEENVKRPCKRFFQGNCEYGQQCRFSHLSDEDKNRLQLQVRADREARQQLQEKEDKNAPNLDEWLSKRDKLLKKDDPDAVPATKNSFIVPKYTLPQSLSEIPNLPPSVLPPTQESYVNIPYDEWG